ncbi:MAG: 30S ribosomal protein S27ae [archaeon]
MAEKKKKKNSKASYYKLEGDSIKRAKKSCPKCGAGVFMAEHKDRHSCGACGYTEIKK